jgi:hypothetical protein
MENTTIYFLITLEISCNANQWKITIYNQYTIQRTSQHKNIILLETINPRSTQQVVASKVEISPACARVRVCVCVSVCVCASVCVGVCIASRVQRKAINGVSQYVIKHNNSLQPLSDSNLIMQVKIIL